MYMKYIVKIVAVLLLTLLPFVDKFMPHSKETGTIIEISEAYEMPIPHKIAKIDNGEEVIEATLYLTSTSYEVGENVMIQKDPQQPDLYSVSDKTRTKPLIQLFILFIAIILIVSGGAGVRSLMGLGFSFLVIFKIVLPQIVMGSNPITVALMASSLILMVSYYLTHGINQKSTIAILGTLGALIITGILASIFATASHLSGFGAEETAFLLDKLPVSSFYNLLLAGFIIGSLGVLDDITISQASIVAELSEANKKLGMYELYIRAMRIGHDHISSLVNTLVLVYAGSALPLLLIFITSDVSTVSLLNYEAVAEEIVRTLVGSIGLVTAVPFTTLIASYHFGTKR